MIRRLLKKDVGNNLKIVGIKYLTIVVRKYLVHLKKQYL